MIYNKQEFVVKERDHYHDIIRKEKLNNHVEVNYYLIIYNKNRKKDFKERIKWNQNH